ncbi:AAWKG family protein [Streptomyces sp. NPDC056224]|uniref:AAWKG family protein n=1 Tax=Streptomyces sp. NPDC056224 TaxID=3345750 RepID=UPI0035E2507A
MADTDYWAKVVKQFTGYPVPSRETLFKKGAEETPQIPLFGLELHPTTEIQAVNLNEIGWNRSKSDEYGLTFYTTERGDGAHRGVAMVRAKIHLAAAPRDASVGGVLDTRMRSTETALAQYIWGSKAALDRLYSQHTTEGFDRNGLIVSASDVVDLKSFDRMARAFDRTKRFFEVQADTLKQWEKSFGAEQSSWKGQAAQVFRDLVVQMHRNYESYLTQLGGRNYAPVHVPIHGDPASSRLGDAVIGAQQDVIRNVRYLRGAWDRWAADGKHIPHEWFLEELEKLQRWLFQNNITQVLAAEERDDDGEKYTQYSTTAAFRQNYPGYGDLSNPATWTKIGDAAIQRWSTHAEAAIAQHAKSALSNLNNHWLDAATAFDEPLQTKGTSSPSQSWQQSQAQALGVTAQGLNGALDGARGAISGLNGNTIGQSGLGVAGLEQRARNLNAVLDGLGADPATKGNLPNSRNGASSDTGRSADTSGFTDTLGLRSLAALNSIPAGAMVPRPDFGTTGTDSLTNPGGGSTTRTTDGSLATSYPDGALGLLNPATGLLTTTSKDGKTAKTILAPGVAVTNPDGSMSTLKPDGSVDTTFADGTVQSIGSDGTVSTTRPDGSVTTTQLNPAAGSFSTPGGGNARLNADGSLSTLFPGGVTETVDPRTGTVTTTSPDGTTSTSLLNRGAEFANPDGSITTLGRDGSLSTVFPDGTTQTVGSDGALTTTRPDGSVTTTQLNPAAGSFSTPGGGNARLNADGSLSTLFPGGVTETVDPRTGTVTTTSPDGTTSTSLLNRGAEFANPDGSITTLGRDGSLSTVFPDGTTQTVGSDGALTTTRPDGSVTTTQLNPAANAFTPSGGRSVPELPDPYSFQPGEAAVNSGVSGFSSLNSGGLESSSLDSTTVPAAAGASSYEEYDSTPYSGGSLRAPAAESTDSAASAAGGGVPLNPMAMGGMGGMGMGMGGMGMGGMGGGGGGGSNSERVRNVLSDNDGAALRRSRTRTARADEEEDVVFTRGGRPVATSSTPYLPAGTPSGQGGQSTESGDRRRVSWVQEEEDVWGKDEGGAPAVIGR